MIEIKIGDVFERLTVVSKEIIKKGRPHYRCHCSCGKNIFVYKYSLSGGQKSCGCWISDHSSTITHGMCGTKVYLAWKSMRRRCNNPNEKSWPDYGGRGIKVCKRWDKFANFFADMGDLPAPGYTIERIDVNGNYQPSNCKWIKKADQCKNMRKNVFLTIDGQTKIVADWARETGVNVHTLWTRLYTGWSPKDAISPKKKKGRYG